MRNYHVNQWYKGETNQLLTLALRSTVIGGSMASIALLYAFLVGWLSPSLRPPLKTLLGASLIVPIAITALKIDDACDDWRVWATQNSAEKRIAIMDQVAEGSIANLRSYNFGQPEDLRAWTFKEGYKHYLSQVSKAPQAPMAPQNPVAIAPPPQVSPQPWDPSETLASDPYSSIIAGVPSAGKGIVVSNALRKLRAKFPDISITVLEPKGDSKEAGYWDIEGVTVHSFRCMQHSPEELRDWLLDEIDTFRYSLTSPRLLVVDELAMILSSLGTLPSKTSGIAELKLAITQITSTGDSQGAWVWLLTQVVNSADLGFSAGFRDMMRPLALISPRNANAAKALLRTSFVSNPGFEEIKNLCSQSPVGRAGYNGQDGNWYPIAKLPNYSSQDRDSRF